MLEKIRHWPWLGIVLVVSCIVAGCTIVVCYDLSLVTGVNKTPANLGVFGDFIGGLMNPIVAFCALIGIWTSVGLQKKELAEIRKGQDKQNNQQRFFDMLKLYQNALDGIENTKSQDAGYNQQQLLTKKGVAAIRMMFAGHAENGSTKWSNLQKFIDDDDSMRGSEKLVLAKESWWRIAFQFDHYFRICYRILLEAEDLLKGEDDRYIKLFRAQLSQEELQLLAFNLIFRDTLQKSG